MGIQIHKMKSLLHFYQRQNIPFLQSSALAKLYRKPQPHEIRWENTVLRPATDVRNALSYVYLVVFSKH
jgi:hypothetical protein